MDSTKPPWQKRLENGALGEARTKALLLDRFWILERTIDIEGADFIIQRRLHHRSLLDPHAPRLGYVQSKYFQDHKTRQYIHREYIVDTDGIPYGEFFLLCHSGIAADSEIFFLSALDIKDNFRLSEPESANPDCYVLAGPEVLTDHWKVTDRSELLNRIERALVQADFAHNRRFLLSVLPDDPSDSILPEFSHSIDPLQNDIPDKFRDLRKQATDEGRQLVDKLVPLTTIANTDDPLEAAEMAEQMRFLLGGRWDAYDSDFHRAVLREREWYDLLHKAGLIDAQRVLKESLRRTFVADCVAKFPFNPDDLYLVTVNDDVTNLALLSLSTAFAGVSPDRISLDICKSTWDGMLGVEDMPCGTAKGFIGWRYFRPEIWTSQGVEPETKIAWIVDKLLNYMMYEILEWWRYTTVSNNGGTQN